MIIHDYICHCGSRQTQRLHATEISISRNDDCFKQVNCWTWISTLMLLSLWIELQSWLRCNARLSLVGKKLNRPISTKSAPVFYIKGWHCCWHINIIRREFLIPLHCQQIFSIPSTKINLFGSSYMKLTKIYQNLKIAISVSYGTHLDETSK